MKNSLIKVFMFFVISSQAYAGFNQTWQCHTKSTNELNVTDDRPMSVRDMRETSDYSFSIFMNIHTNTGWEHTYRFIDSNSSKCEGPKCILNFDSNNHKYELEILTINNSGAAKLTDVEKNLVTLFHCEMKNVWYNDVDD